MLAFARAEAAPRLELLGPSGASSPDGFVLAVRQVDDAGQSLPLSALEIKAEGADLMPGPPEPGLSTYVVAPKPGARQVRIAARAGAAQASEIFSLGPPAARVALHLEPAAPVKNRDQGATLTVRMLKPDGSIDPDSAPPVLRANVGEISALEPLRPGEYRARYQLPSTRYPEVAVIVALSAWPHPQSVHGVFGAVRVPLASAIELPGQTEPNATMSITIAGQTYGPVQAAADGRFRLPVVVPPGYGTGIGTAVDRVGNRRTSPIDLMLPPTDQLACVMNPTRLPADGVSRARVLCATSDPFGKVLAHAKVQLSAKSGALSAPRPREDGIIEWLYTAPRALGDGGDELIATSKQGRVTSREALRVELVQGPVARLELNVRDELVHHGGSTELRVRALDALGRPRSGVLWQPGASVGALTSAGPSDAPGAQVLRLQIPAAGDEKASRVRVRALGPLGLDPARLTVFRRGGETLVAVTDLAGLPVPRQPLRVNGVPVTTGDDGAAPVTANAQGLIDVRHAQWPGLAATAYLFDGGARLFPKGSPAGAVEVEAVVPLAPPAPVNVRVAVEGRTVRYWAESLDGAPLPDRQLVVALSSGTPGPVRREAGRYVFEAQVNEPATISIADQATGVTALAEVRP